MIEGNIDRLDRHGIAGWAYDSSRPDQPIIVSIFVNGQLLSKVEADDLRSDLVAAGKGNGRHAFRLPFTEEIDAALLPHVVAKVEDIALVRADPMDKFELSTQERVARKLMHSRTKGAKNGIGQWSLDACTNDNYRHKFLDVVQILGEWFEPYGGLRDRDVLEFGCGEATVALGVALQHEPRRMVGVEILDIYKNCLPFAQKNLGLQALPQNLEIFRITPGEDISRLGTFDFIYTWSVFEHVSQEYLERAFASLKAALRPEGAILLQISPLYYSRDGSHLTEWIPVPWGHLSMQNNDYFNRLMSAEETPERVRQDWTVYISLDADRDEERRLAWELYDTLNKATALQLSQIANKCGLKIVRDYRTKNDDPIPENLLHIYSEDVLRTEQIVWLLQHA
jgi:SAM-dependent methyltransferase